MEGCVVVLTPFQCELKSAYRRTIQNSPGGPRGQFVSHNVSRERDPGQDLHDQPCVIRTGDLDQ